MLSCLPHTVQQAQVVECMCDSRNECYIISRARITYIMCTVFEESDMVQHTVIAVFTVTLV